VPMLTQNGNERFHDVSLLTLVARGQANPSFALGPDPDPPDGPELVAPPADLPDFQLDWACCDDQTANDRDAPDIVVLKPNDH
jgi:hypothetical protein